MKCHCCGAEYTLAEAVELPRVGVHLGCLELRQCPCGNTLSLDVDTDIEPFVRARRFETELLFQSNT